MSYKHCQRSAGAVGAIGHTKCSPEGVGYELEGRWRRGRGLALHRFSVLARFRLRLICCALCLRLIRHQRAGTMQSPLCGINSPYLVHIVVVKPLH